LGQSWNVLGLGGLWGVQTIAYFPFACQLIADVLARSDPRMEQAARNLGAGPWQVSAPSLCRSLVPAWPRPS
jgi:ABC-type Fe3+ transport system permease subunit